MNDEVQGKSGERERKKEIKREIEKRNATSVNESPPFSPLLISAIQSSVNMRNIATCKFQIAPIQDNKHLLLIELLLCEQVG